MFCCRFSARAFSALTFYVDNPFLGACFVGGFSGAGVFADFVVGWGWGPEVGGDESGLFLSVMALQVCFSLSWRFRATKHMACTWLECKANALGNYNMQKEHVDIQIGN